MFADAAPAPAAAAERLRDLLRDRTGLAKFKELVANQAGDPAVADDPSILPTAQRLIEVPAPRSGTIASLDALAIGRATSLLGAGRFVKDEPIDPAVGIELLHKVGDTVADGQPLVILHVDDEANLEAARDLVASAYTIGTAPATRPKLILERVTA